MDLSEIIGTARQLLRNGETGKSLQILIAFLEDNPQYRESIKTLQVMEANFNAVRQQEIKGILSFQEAQRSYSQINDGLFSALDTLASGRPLRMEAPKSTRRLWIVAASLLLLAGLIATYILTRGDQPGLHLETATTDCPQFNGNGPAILLLPFQSVTKSNEAPELLIQTRIQRLSNDNNFPLDVKVLTTYDSQKENPDPDKALAVGKNCQAEMVIWGLFIINSKEEIQMDTRFVYTQQGKQGSTGFSKSDELINISTGAQYQVLDDAVFSICATMAMRQGREDLTKKWIAKIKNPNVRDQAIANAMQQ